MNISKDILAFEAKLKAAIKSTLENELANEIKDEMSENIEKYEFTRSRGPSGMGVRDKRNFKTTIEDSGDYASITALGIEDMYILRVTDIAKFQSDVKKDKSLAEVVEDGDERYRMHMARPFIAPTQQNMDYGTAEAVVAEGLRKHGLTVI